MKIKKILPLLVVGAIAAVAVFGVAVFQSVQASSPESTALVAEMGRGGGSGGVSDTQLAAALGITVEKLQAAEQTASDEFLKEAVAKGLITQAQADQMKARSGQGKELGRFGVKSSDLNYDTFLAKALGITSEQLTAAYQKAYLASIDQAVTDGKMTQEQADLAKARYLLSNNAKYQSSMQTAFEAAVKQAVSDGVITQAQADLILKNTPSFGVRGLGGKGGFEGLGGSGMDGRGGHGGRGDFDGQGVSPKTKPTTTPGSGT